MRNNTNQQQMSNSQQQISTSTQQVHIPPWMNWLALVIIPLVGLGLTAYSLFSNSKPTTMIVQYGTQPNGMQPIENPQQPNPIYPQPPNDPHQPPFQQGPQGNIPTGPEFLPPPQPVEMPDNTPEWIYQTLRCRETANFPANIPAQDAIRMAKEIAEEKATRQLMDRVYDLQLDPQTAIREFVMRHPELDKKLRNIVTKLKPSSQNLGTTMVVTLEIPLEKIWKIMEPTYRAEK